MISHLSNQVTSFLKQILIMKTLNFSSIVGVIVVLSSCGALDKLNKPISDSGYNPLDKPGVRLVASSNDEARVDTNSYGFNNGDIVEVVIPNTALFKQIPKPGDRYDKVLKVGDSLRVIGGEKDFIKVVTEKNETGYVSSVMVVAQGFLSDIPPVDPNVTVVGAGETPIVPDIAPDPTVKGLTEPEVATIPVPATDLSLPTVPEAVPDFVPDPTPVVPSLPDIPEVPEIAPEPTVPSIPE